LNVQQLWDNIVDIIIKTLISCQHHVNKLILQNAKNRYNCYELLGFDIILDDNYKPWLLEVNISPSLRSDSELDTEIKSRLIKDMLNIAGYRIPLFSFKGHSKAYEASPKGGDEIDLDNVCFQSVYFDFEKRLTSEEKEKHEYFEKLGHGSNPHILSNLLSDDILILTETEDELSRCGDFVRVFPSQHSSPYLQYFETTNYYNLLLDEWEKRFGQKRMEGIKLLRSHCAAGKHINMQRYTVLDNQTTSEEDFEMAEEPLADIPETNEVISFIESQASSVPQGPETTSVAVSDAALTPERESISR